MPRWRSVIRSLCFGLLLVEKRLRNPLVEAVFDLGGVKLPLILL